LAATDCTFCSIIAGEIRAEFVLEEPDVVAFLDHRPVFKGHVLVAPRAHVLTLVDLPEDLFVPVFGAVQRCAAAMPAAVGAQGSWVSVNNVVSQSVPHMHVHVVPRTKGDGLRGFFWPRTKYADDAEIAAYGARLRDAIAAA
jgi:histidine triad (HIT) family protein